MTTERMDYYSVVRYVARCAVDGCTWRQEHFDQRDAESDGERHLAEQHDPPPTDEAS